MNLPIRWWTVFARSTLATCLGGLALPSLALSQATAPAAAPASAATAPAPAAAAPAAAATPPVEYRKLGPGVMIAIPPDRRVEESFSRHDVVELLKADASFKFAENTTFRRDVWALEFQFKPMRVINVDIPQPSRLMRTKPIWYMVYTVTNPGKVMRPVPVDKDELLSTLDAAAKDPEKPAPPPAAKEGAGKDGTCYIQHVNQPVHFTPQFLLNSWKPSTPNFNKWYPDRFIPEAIGPIQLREDPNRRLLSSVEMDRDIEPGQTLWGVVTWESIDPRTTHFSVYVYGLTNAYQWTDDPNQIKGEDARTRLGAGRQLYRKTLKLDFWRPGNEEVKEGEIRFGIPGAVDYEWVYR